MSETTEQQMPQPTAEHQRITAMAGKWKVHCTFWMDPSQPPMECDATETFEAVGPFWVVSKYETDFMGMPFVGRCSMGYDPHRKVYVSTWVDCMTPVLFSFTGNMKGDTLVMTGEAWSCRTNGPAKYRTTNQAKGKDEWTFEMFEAGKDGKEMKTMRMVYKRA